MYIDIKEAAEVMQLTIQAVYQAIRYGTLKSKKISGKLFTTSAWIDEYNAHLCSKQVHSRFNGRPTFDISKGEYSLKMASEALSLPTHVLQYMIENGTLKAFKRGIYWVITQDEIERVSQIRKEKRKSA